MSEEVEENTCAEAAQVIEHLVQSIPCSSVDVPPPVSKAEPGEDEAVKRIVIDESDDENHSLNMGLTYADHNYDVPDPAKRFRPDPNESKKFETIDGLTINEKNELVFTTSRTRDIIRSQPFAREAEDRRRSEPSFRFGQRRVDYSPGFPESSTPYSINRNSSSGYYISDGRSGNIRAAAASKPRTLSTSGIAQNLPGDVYGSQRKIEASQRVHDFRHNTIVANRQTVGGHFNSADPSQAAVANAPAPLLVCGNRNVIHRNPTRAKRDESAEPLSLTSPILRSPLHSPRKVHFLDGDATSQSPNRCGESRGPLLLSTSGALQRKLPQSKPVPPHRQISISAPNSNVPMRNMPARLHVPSNDPHSLPDNIIEDTKNPKLEMSPSHVHSPQEVLSRPASEKTNDTSGNSTAEMIKEKIATVTREIEMEKMFEKPSFDASASNGAESIPYETIRARGRPRGNWNNRTRNSLSNSSGTIGSSSPQSAYTNGSPTKSFNISYSNSKERPPVRSPTRANLDLNNHVSFGNIESSKSSARHSFPFSKKVTNKAEVIVPTRGRGRKKRDKVVTKKSDTDVTAEEEEDEEEGTWEARCVCTLDHGLGLCVCCDRCNMWQHAPCYGFSTDEEIPDKWLCEICKPRKLTITKEHALRIQEELGFHHPIRKVRSLTKEAKQHTPAKPVKANYNRKYQDVLKNNFTKHAKQLLELTPDSGYIRKDQKDSFKSCTKTMFVAPDIEGLVCTRDINSGDLIIEFIGQVMLPNERTREGFQRFSLLYDGLNCSTSAGQEEKNTYICIDASKIGGDGRFARRSCRPNCSVRHILQNGHLNVYLVANESFPDGTEVTIPFDIDSSTNDMQMYCWCSLQREKDKCLFRQSETLYILGHAARKEDELDSSNLEDDKKADKRGRPKGKGRRSKLGTQNGAAEEVKVKEEVEVQKEVKEETTAIVTNSKVSSDEQETKPEVKKEEVVSRPSRKIKDLEKSNVNYTLPADRNKPSREEMKIQQQLALMESAKSKKDSKQTEKRKSKSSAESPSRRRSRKDTEKEREKERVENQEDMETPKYQPPRKRWLQKEKTLANSAPAATCDQKVKLEPDSEESAVVPSKKQWLRRHAAAQSEQIVTPTTSSTLSPSKKRKATKSSEDTSALNELRVQLQLNADTVLEKMGEVYYELPKHIEGVPSVKEKKEEVQEEPKIKQEPIKEEDDSKSKVEEPPQKNPKRLSIEDYRKRRPRVPSNETSNVRVERSFIPSMDNIADQTLLLPITLPDPTRSSLDALKKDIYGEMTGTNDTLDHFGSLSPQASHSTSYVSTGSERVRSPQKTNIPRVQPSPPPRPSIADRLAVEFGLEFSPKKQENEVPPVTQLPVCPPPVSRREQSSANVQLNRASTRKSRW
ncbi:unnamed protein product [Auanema sp. JU1783]|nr:unnamed protein product [Auanema sp. JU1783]